MSNLYTVRKVVSQLKENEKQAIVDYFLVSVLPPDRQTALLLFLYDIFDERRFINKIMESVHLINTPEIFYETYWNISNRLFNKTKTGKFNNTPLRDCFVSISKNIRELLTQRGDVKKKKINKVTTIAILSP